MKAMKKTLLTLAVLTLLPISPKAGDVDIDYSIWRKAEIYRPDVQIGGIGRIDTTSPQTVCVWEIDSSWIDGDVLAECRGKWISSAWCVDTIPHWFMVNETLTASNLKGIGNPTRVDTLPKIIVYVHDTVFVPAKTPCDHAWEWEYQYGFGGSATGWINEVYLCRDHYNLIGNSRCIYCGETRRRK